VPPSPQLAFPLQGFTETSDPSAVAGRVARLRAELARRGLDGFVIPRADQHQGEYVPPCDERLAWLTGFTGSAGSAVVLSDKAALVVDGRYTIQAAAQTDTDVVAIVRMAETPLESWLTEALPSGARLGYDPWLHTPDQARKLSDAAQRAGAALVAVEGNPIDAIWVDRPPEPTGKAFQQPVALAGEAAADKIARVRSELAKARCDALVVSDPHNLCWLMNLRGADVRCTPLLLGYAIVTPGGAANGPVTLALAPGKVDAALAEQLKPLATIEPVAQMPQRLAALAATGATVRLDAATAAMALKLALEAGGAKVEVAADPISLMKAKKNAAELDGARAAHRRDAAAFARFLAWFDETAPEGGLTEISAALMLERFRHDTGALRDLAFPTISAAGPNAALPHYRVTEASNRPIGPGIYLVDSGAQYADGTTDITRTLVVDEPSPQMRDRYTRVLKGHIAISRAAFPRQVSGAQLDAFARQFLWSAGLDFDHGTGHGVGAYLSVHEGPQRLSKLGHTNLEPGMILSNEPGYYREGAFGIRIENLIVVEPRAIPGAEREMFGFETLTLAPYDRALIETSLLTADEWDWIDAYHARVLAEVGPLVDADTKGWLEQACAPL
jgi:Xaa-Pro aminopeptidase